MISFTLCCEKEHAFEAWFRSGELCDSQLAANEIPCPVCGSTDVTKALMAPNVAAKSNRGAPDGVPVPAQGAQVAAPGPDPAVAEMVEQMRKLRQHVQDNSEYVGDRFAEEARRIHHDESEKRGIYGEATLEDARELHEDGIDVLPLPRLPEDQN